MSELETKNLADLHGNPKNPRTMSKHDAAALKRSLAEFGDLSGIIYNTVTGQLVGGHMRTETFKQLAGDKQVIITKRYEEPNHVGTVAIGYVSYNNEFYGYREVAWPLERETAANIAANRIQGDWDTDLLAEANQMLSEQDPDLLELTGQEQEEIDRLAGVSSAGAGGDGEEKDSKSLPFKCSTQQLVVMYEAISRMKATRQLGSGPDPELDGLALYHICQDYLDADQP